MGLTGLSYARCRAPSRVRAGRWSGRGVRAQPVRVQDAQGLRRRRGEVPADPRDRVGRRGGGGARGTPAVKPGETVAALMGETGREFDGGYAEYALVPEHQSIALDTTLPWHVLGALPETFVTAAGSLEHLDLEEGKTLLLRGATSSVGLACLELARAAGVRVIATTRSEAKGRRLTQLGAAGIVLEGEASPSAPGRSCPRAAPTAPST